MVMVCPLLFQISTLAPCSMGGSLTPVEAAEVVIALYDAGNCKAVACVLPVATKPVWPAPAIVCAICGELPEARTCEGIVISLSFPCSDFFAGLCVGLCAGLWCVALAMRASMRAGTVTLPFDSVAIPHKRLLIR